MRYLLFLTLLTLTACGGSSESEVETPPSDPYEAATKMAQKQMEGLQQNNNREVLEAAAVKEMLPETQQPKGLPPSRLKSRATSA